MIDEKPKWPKSSVLDVGQQAEETEVPWSTAQTFRGTLITLIPWIVFSLVLTATSTMSTSTPRALTYTEDLTGMFTAFLFSGLLESVFLWAPVHYARKALAEVEQRGRRVIHALGFRRFQVGPALLWILGLLVLVFAFDYLYSFLIDYYHLNITTNDQTVLNDSALEPLTTYGLLAASILFAPFCEEIFFRGFLLGGLLREVSPMWAVLISSALFAIAHTDPGSFLPLLVIGLGLGFLRYRTKSIWPGIMLHMLNNLISSADIILVMHHINLPF